MHGLGAERARLDDWVAGLDVEIADRRKDPIQPDRSRFSPGDGSGPLCRVQIVEVPQGAWGRKLREAANLLPCPALEIRAEQQRPAGLGAQRGGEGGDRSTRTTKKDEAAHTGGQRCRDLRLFRPERAPPPAQRRTNQARVPDGHTGVMCPNTRGPRAPVAAGRLPGFPATVCIPRNANATASFASPLKNT